MKYLFALTLLALAGCGDESIQPQNIPVQGDTGKQGVQGAPGTSCSVTQNVSGASVVCTDGTSANISNGSNGNNGSNGSNGLSIVSEFIVATSLECPTGGFVLLEGQDVNRSGIFAPNDTDIQSAPICNGAKGDKGDQGAQASMPDFSPAIAITPCGPNSSSFKEALLGLTGGGVFSEIITQSGNANTIRNSLLGDGSYSDTDDSACNFSISTDSHGNRTISWNGSSANNSGPYHAGSAFYNANSKVWVAVY